MTKGAANHALICETTTAANAAHHAVTGDDAVGEIGDALIQQAAAEDVSAHRVRRAGIALPADDVGGGIVGAHVDFFAAEKKNYQLLNGKLDLSMVTAYSAPPHYP